jgi:glycosyltransferase involved in cell wall biosynthesis
VIVSVGIKALNEERHIAQAVASAVAAVAPFEGEVILADSGSTDRTLEIARNFPIRIVQLAHPEERRCGAGAQLAFQHAQGQYFYLLDGDMVLDPGFLAAGISFLERNPEVAAVGGRVVEANQANAEFQIRAEQASGHWRAGLVDRLDCGGLYRTDVVRELGYFADRNLHAFEEFELGARIRREGWKLARIDVPAVNHYGHTDGGYRLLWKRMRSGYSACVGEVVRSGAFTRQWREVLSLSHIRQGVAVVGWWLLLFVMGLINPLWLIPLIALPILALSIRRGRPSLGLYSFVQWNVVALGLVTGVFQRRQPPQRPIESRFLQ